MPWCRAIKRRFFLVPKHKMPHPLGANATEHLAGARF